MAKAIAAIVVAELRAGDKKLLSIKEAAAYLGISRRVFEGLMYNGKIPIVREGTLKRFDREDLDRWIQLRKGRG
ncbi:MAG: helix-turn-helix domain-containing protein [Ignavibacteriota bacterium]